jgi:sortase A
MTLAGAPTQLDEQNELVEEPLPEEQPSSVSPAKLHRWRRRVAFALVTLLALVLLIAIFTGPIERVWFRTRQHHLAADLAQPRPGVTQGQALGVVQVPRLGLNVVVVEGDTPELLRGAPGHRISSAKPGARGNVVISGHHDAWGGPFAALDRIRAGDLIAVQNRQGKVFVYRTRSIRRVSPDEAQLLRPAKDHRLTLVTGRGGSLSRDKTVITAVSGKVVRDPYRSRAVRATTPGRSVLFNGSLLLALAAFALAGLAIFYLRRRVGRLAMIVVVVPLIAAGALLLLLDLSLLLPPLA